MIFKNIFSAREENAPLSSDETDRLFEEALNPALVRVSEAAALASARLTGRGDKNAADGAAVKAMREAFDTLPINGTVVIGEGEMDEAPMLFIGEKVGGGGFACDIATDPLEGTNAAAKAGPNAMTVVALAHQGCFLHAPDVYMEKIAVGADLPENIVDLDAPVIENLKNLAKARQKSVSELSVCLLDRPRHADIIAQCREAGTRLVLIPDGDVSGVLAVAMNFDPVDLYLGTGGAPEGVLAAAALRCLGGQMQGRLVFENDVQFARAQKMGITDKNRKYRIEEMAGGDVLFAASGVTGGTMLQGVRFTKTGAVTHSVMMSSRTKAVRYIETHHKKL